MTTENQPARMGGAEWAPDANLEAISERIRMGIPVGYLEAIAAINYQATRQAYARKNVWWRRAIKWIRSIA